MCVMCAKETAFQSFIYLERFSKRKRAYLCEEHFHYIWNSIFEKPKTDSKACFEPGRGTYILDDDEK